MTLATAQTPTASATTLGRVSLPDRAARQLARRLFSTIRGGTLRLRDPLGSSDFGDGRGPVCEVTVTDLRAYRALMRGSVGLGRAYSLGWWETPDLTGLLRLAHRSLSRMHPATNRIHDVLTPVLDPFARRRPPRPQRDRENISAHYDLGNDFFATILDDTMMYSCAVFEPTGISLQEASVEKLRRVAMLAELQRDQQVLEIGTGWGGFAKFAATEHAAQVTTTTISAEQYAHATAEIQRAGLSDRVAVLASDYRDLGGTYDAIVSIEMIEAVDWTQYDTFFQTCSRLLKPGGTLAMQAIVINDASFNRAKRRTDFIKEAIFPGGCLPSVAALTASAGRNGLTLQTHNDIGSHYATTLSHWRDNLAASQIDRGEEFARLWDFYFAYCQAGFEEGYISVAHLQFTSPTSTEGT